MRQQANHSYNDKSDDFTQWDVSDEASQVILPSSPVSHSQVCFAAVIINMIAQMLTICRRRQEPIVSVEEPIVSASSGHSLKRAKKGSISFGP